MLEGSSYEQETEMFTAKRAKNHAAVDTKMIDSLEYEIDRSRLECMS